MFISMFILMTSLFTTFAVCGFSDGQDDHNNGGLVVFIMAVVAQICLVAFSAQVVIVLIIVY